MTCYNPSPSSHISPWCLTEACDIVLIFTLLFSIKGQTVQNSTVIPHTLCSHLTPVSFYFLQTVYHVTAQLLNQGFWRRSCDNASLHYIHLILYVTELWPRTYLCTFSPQLKQQIRKLRRELDASQEKVATLTSQLAANVSLFTPKKAV